MLDAFSYTGGFGLHASKAGATGVECVDVSEVAVRSGGGTRSAMDFRTCRSRKPTCFAIWMTRSPAAKSSASSCSIRRNSPASRSSIPDAIRGYRQLLKQGLKLAEPGGFVIFCCCSGLITQDDITQLIAQTAGEERRDVQILERRGAAPDHPVAASCIETAYLKCFVLRVN